MKDWEKFVRGIIWVTVASLCASPLPAQQEGGERPNLRRANIRLCSTPVTISRTRIRERRQCSRIVSR